MPLTTAQLATLKTSIIADVTANAFRVAGDTFGLLGWCNGDSSMIVWKTQVTLNQIGDKMNGTEFSGLTTANVSRLSAFADYSPMGINPALADRRSFFADVFSVGGITAAALLALWKRAATNAEKVFAVGTGTTLAPAALGWEGVVTQAEANALVN